MALNKCEQFLLKLVIPFVRVQHIPRSAEFKQVGPMICVESQVKETVNKILPVDQDLIAVCLKRKPEYKGSYVEQIVSKSKILEYFEYFKQNNPLFADVQFDESKMDDFLKNSLAEIEAQEKWKHEQVRVDAKNQECVHESDAQSDDDDMIEDSLPDIEATHDQTDSDEDYDLPSYLTEIPADTVIDPLTKSENRMDISEVIANAVIEKEKCAKRKMSGKMTTVTVAPGAEGSFQYWEKAHKLEEKAFPHLFPTGEGGYLSEYQEKGVSFANYIKQRILGVDSRFREDSTYMFFLYNIKEQLEIKRSYATFFRKSKVNRDKYDVAFLRGSDKSEIERTDIGYKVFKNVRGTAPYFQQVKLKVLAMIRQLGAPQLFLTMSAAEAHWTELIIMLLQKERKKIVTKDDAESLSRTQLNQLLDRNVIDVTAHFSNRMKVIYRSMRTHKLLAGYRVVDHFFRIEFQQRGAPHVHSLLWLQDEDGRSPPQYDGSDESVQATVAFIDSVICGQLPTDDRDILDHVQFCQTHSHTFTCRKKSRKIKLKADEGHGRLDGTKKTTELVLDSCRFKFPKFPMRKTTILKAPGTDDCDIDEAKVEALQKNYLMVRKYILRQTWENAEEFRNLSFDQFLDNIGLSEQNYVEALSIGVSKSRSGIDVFLKRDCRDLFTNNYNRNLLKIHNANMDLSYIIDEYACVAYILGYMTKNESGVSRLLHQIETESKIYGRSPQEKLKVFSRALDNSREVSRPEVVYRMLSLHFCESTRNHAFVQTSHPNCRDGLLKSHIEELNDDENPFFNSPVDYYVNRPDDLESLSLAQFIRDYSIVYQSRIEKQSNEHINIGAEEDSNMHDMSAGKVRFLKCKKGRFRQNKKDTIVRYHISRKSDTDIKRDLLILFHPFRDEISEIHEPRDKTIDDVYSMYKEDIENVRRQFEPNRELVVTMEKIIEDFSADGEDEDELEDEEDDQDASKVETTSAKDLDHYLNLSGKKCDEEMNMLTKRRICEMVRLLNRDQRRIFDDVIERLIRVNSDESTSNGAVPFYLYIAGSAGVGKSYLMKVLIEAAKFVLMKSGDDLDKPSVLVLSPTASAARLIGGQTIESAMKLWRSDDSESYEIFSNRSTCAYEYSQVRAIFIDEISMVGSSKANSIHLRCEELFGRKSEPFSAVPVICTGDFHQLPPVQDRWIFDNTKQENRCDATAPNKWKQNFRMYELTEKMRSLADPEFSSLCDRIATNTITATDINILRSRIVECADENSNEAYKEGDLAIIVRDNALRESINSEKLCMIQSENFAFECEDVCRTANKYAKNDVLKLPYTQTGQLPSMLEVKVDAPIMLTTNINKSDGLTNGSRGYVAHVDRERAIIWVKFHGDVGKKAAAIGRQKYNFQGRNGAVPILKMKATFRHRGSIRIQRTQFPLVLAYSITSHKSQGQTLKKVIVDFSGNRRTDAGSFYVAVTRVRKLSDLFLKKFEPSFIKVSAAVSAELSRLRDRARYQFFKQPLTDDVFTYENLDRDELRITYININGLLDAGHFDDLKSDINLTSSDILCVAETKLDPSILADRLEIDNFDVVSRLDYRNRSMGMILYVRRDRHFQVNVQVEASYENPKVQVVYISIDGTGVLFSYVHPSGTTLGLSKVKGLLTGGGEIVMGDLNIDYMKDAGRKKLDKFAAENSLRVAQLDCTRDQSHLDHILIPTSISDEFKYRVESYANLYSDHSAISIRLSKNAVE